jgi:hypothetical protein
LNVSFEHDKTRIPFTADPGLAPRKHKTAHQIYKERRPRVHSATLKTVAQQSDEFDADLEISPESLLALDRLADPTQEGVDDKADEEDEDANEQNEPTAVPDVMPDDESDDDDGNEERQTTPEQAATKLKETREQVQQIIADADRLAQATSPGTLPVDGPTPQTEDEFTELVRRVLGDAFHFMDRVKVPVCRCIRSHESCIHASR